MRRSAFLLVVVVFLAAVVFAASASASTTYHGKFTSATGMHKTDGFQTIGANGTWNVIRAAQATRITGLAHVYHFHTDMVPLTENSPTGLHTGTWLITWTDIAWSPQGVLTAHGTLTLEAYLPPGWFVGLTFTLDPAADIPAKLRVDLSSHYVSEAGWRYWDIYGDLTQ